MGAALLGKDVVAEAQYILLKCVHELDGGLHLHLVHGSLEIDGVVYRRFAGVQFPHIGNNALRLMEGHLLSLSGPLVFIIKGQVGI